MAEHYADRVSPQKPPRELTGLDRWVCWEYATIDGKLRKIPKDPATGGDAKADDPATWGSYDEATQAAGRYGFSGIGIELGSGRDLLFIDLDHVLDPVTEYTLINDEIDDALFDSGRTDGPSEFSELVEELCNSTYCEYSPGGDGLHILLRGSKPSWLGRCSKQLPAVCGQEAVPQVECYDHGRYSTVTGKRYRAFGRVASADEVAEPLERFLRIVFGGSDGAKDEAGGADAGVTTVDPARVEADDAGLATADHRGEGALDLVPDADTALRIMRDAANWPKFRPLFEDGDLSAYKGNHSRADLALCSALAFYTDKQPLLMDDLFRRSALMRGKWDRIHDPAGHRTYGQMTIDKAIDLTGETVSGNRRVSDRTIGRPGEHCGQSDASREHGPVAPMFNDKRKPTVAEVVETIGWDRHLGGRIGFNELEGAVFVIGPTPWDETGYPRRWGDADLASLYAHLQGYNYKTPKDNVADALTIYASQNHYNPLTDELRGLAERQQGRGYAPHLLAWFLGAEDDRYTQEVTLGWMRMAVARAFRPGIVAPWMPVLYGPQGCGKSLFCGRMALRPEWFTDSVGDLSNLKTTAEALSGRWVAEIGELSAMRGKEIEGVKATITRTDDLFRPAYGRYTESHPRRSVFIGTTNSASFLRDRTGNRRFYPVRLAVHRRKFDLRDADAVAPVIREAWGEIVAEYLAASRKARTDDEFLRLFPMEPPEDVRRDAEAVRDDFAERNDNAESIAEYLRLSTGVRVCAAEVAAEALRIEGSDYARNKRLQHEVGEIMDTMPGWHRLSGKQRCGSYGIRTCWQRDGTE